MIFLWLDDSVHEMREQKIDIPMLLPGLNAIRLAQATVEYTNDKIDQTDKKYLRSSQLFHPSHNRLHIH